MKELIKLSTYFEQNPVANHDTLNRDAEQTVNLSLKFDSQKTLSHHSHALSLNASPKRPCNSRAKVWA